MDECSRKKIYELRKKGLYYSQIATEVGLTEKAVTDFCKRNNLKGPAEVVELNIDHMLDERIICNNCHIKLRKKRRASHRRFCSDECRYEWWNKNKDKKTKNESAIYKLVCQNCNKEFSAYGNKKRKFCSRDCYIKNRFWREDDKWTLIK